MFERFIKFTYVVSFVRTLVEINTDVLRRICMVVTLESDICEYVTFN